MIFMLTFTLIFGIFSFLFISRRTNNSGFFLGYMENGKEPSLLVLTFSLVTTWIFSRSLLTAAILAYYYGLPGAIAYTTYYFSFLTGGFFVLKVRKKFKVNSTLKLFENEYGYLGKFTVSFLLVIRLISEIFANLIVVGLIFGNEGSMEYNFAIILIMLVSLSYSFIGGFRNSIKTDFFQMIIFLILMFLLISNIYFSDFKIEINTLINNINNTSNPGYALIAVAFLQIWSYPLHDPVMTDRGFFCSYKKTKQGFFYAFLLSSACIFSFSLLGIFLSEASISNISFFNAIGINLGKNISFIVFLLLLISAISTLDSTLSSASKLIVSDLNLLKKNIFNGRLVMVLFSILGLLFIIFNTKDLFTAVAISGTAATFMTTTFILKVIFNISVSKFSYFISFLLSMLGSIVYYLESQGINNSFSSLFELSHKYVTLLLINIFILFFSFLTAFLVKNKSL